MPDPIAYYVETHRLKQLRQWTDRLCGGTDRERDVGNALHLIVTEIEGSPVPLDHVDGTKLPSFGDEVRKLVDVAH